MRQNSSLHELERGICRNSGVMLGIVEYRLLITGQALRLKDSVASLVFIACFSHFLKVQQIRNLRATVWWWSGFLLGIAQNRRPVYERRVDTERLLDIDMGMQLRPPLNLLLGDAHKISNFRLACIPGSRQQLANRNRRRYSAYLTSRKCPTHTRVGPFPGHAKTVMRIYPGTAGQTSFFSKKHLRQCLENSQISIHKIL